MNQPNSAYYIIDDNEIEKRHIISIIVDNKPGVLARVVGMFSGRGYNIESLNVKAIDKDKKQSRINIVTFGTNKSLKQMKAQISRIISVFEVFDFYNKEHIEKEIALIKFFDYGDNDCIKALRIAEALNAETVHATTENFIFMIEGNESKVSQFVDILGKLGKVEIARSGPVCLSCE